MKNQVARWLLGLLPIFSLMGVLQFEVQAEQTPPTCKVEPVNYKGWQAQQLSNSWVKLIFVPQNGGRLMQVIFDEHSFLFVNPTYAGKYLPPSSTQWFNYGGDKLWVLPEGNDDEQHWVGNSDVLDDSSYVFRVLSQGPTCEVSLAGPADPLTGLQLARTVNLDSDSPRIRFHTVFANASGHPIEWSVQSVTQYDTSDAKDPLHHNKDIWGFSSANPTSAYLNRYHVRFGPAENSAASIRPDGIFSVHYVPLAAELWLDSKDGWLAVVDGASQYAMVERFRYDDTKQYPGKASVIFWTNGPELRQAADGTVTFGRPDKEPPPHYMEAELNSPMVRLYPGESYSFDTEWFPARGDPGFQTVKDSGLVLKPLRAVESSDGAKIDITGTFGVFFPGQLVAYFYSSTGSAMGTQPVLAADPRKVVLLQNSVKFSGHPRRISLHLIDTNGSDRGSLGEVTIEGPDHAQGQAQ
jgi:hypothetical protein